MAKDDQEEAFDKILTSNLQRVLDFLKYAEAKNGALLTIASAWALAVVALLTRDKPIPDNYRLALALALPFIIGAVLAALWSFAPRTRLSRFLGGRRAGPHQSNLLFFRRSGKVDGRSDGKGLSSIVLPPRKGMWRRKAILTTYASSSLLIAKSSGASSDSSR
jgi:hypothetical protein